MKIRYNGFRNVGALVFLSLILIGFLAHVSKVWSIVCDKGVGNLAEFSTAVRKSLVSDFKWKHHFVDINGAYVRAIGQRVCNAVVRLPNGQLQGMEDLSPSDATIANLSVAAKRLGTFSSWLRNRGVPLLYVQAPTKMDLQGKLYPYPVKHSVCEIPDVFCHELESLGVDVLDLRPQLTSSPDAVSRNYFITDHHWTIDAAFSVCPMIAERILGALKLDDRLAGECFDPLKWNRFEKKDWFLGSRGRRVGRFFAGLDDISWYEPKSATKMSCAIHKWEIFRSGSFSDALIKKRELLSEERPPFYTSNPYALYVGGDFPLVAHRNQSTSSKARVLLIKDSYGLPIQAFLSMLFSKVDVVDLRRFDEMTVTEYVESTKPDAVVVMYYPFSLTNPKVTNFGQVPRSVAGWNCVQQCRRVRIKKSSRPYNYFNLTPTTGLRNDCIYRLTLGRGRSVDSSGVGVTVCLHDPTSQKIVAMRVVDLDYINANEDCLSFKVPRTGKWRLLLYAGSRTSTGVEVDIGEVTLYEKSG